MFAVAISNNDMVYLYWHVDAKIPDCLGFSVVRHEVKTGKSQALPTMVGFGKDPQAARKFKSTDDWPVQKFAWKDLYGQRGGSYWYEIVPMRGTPGNLEPAHELALRTNTVTLDSRRGTCSVFFNRGIISTQAIAHNLPKSGNGLPSSAVLTKRIQEPDDPIRARLVGDLADGVLTLLDRAKRDGGECYCALYELSDKELIDRLTALGKSKVHLVLSNAGEDTEEGNGDGDGTNQAVRAELHRLKFDVTDRMLKKGHIGHNKFVVYVDDDGPRAVLTGSTNWTATGLCAQSNNAILVESPALAAEYFDYWKALKEDTEAADGEGSSLQGKQFRTENRKPNPAHDLTDRQGKAAGDVHVWFSPNTSQKSVPRKKKKGGGTVTPPSPPDLGQVFDLIGAAKQGVLFLAFIPGNPSIVSKLKEVYDARRAAGKLFFLRGAATSPDPASEFRVNLYHRSSRADASVRGVDNPPDAAKASARVASVAGIFATFAKWEAELYKLGHAVIHDKILVIDPFTDDSVVVTGSHNLGFKASYSNDENLLVIRNDRAVAEAYAAHVLDVYEHYRWRWQLQQPIRDAFQRLKQKYPHKKPGDLWRQAVDTMGPKVIQEAWHSLAPTDAWQDYYEDHKDELAAEVNFWSPFGGVALADG